MTDVDFERNLKYYADYFIAMLWAENDDDGTPLDSNYDLLDIDRENMIEQFKQLDAFFSEADSILENTDYTHQQTCHDFYFTRCGHGVGFWEADHCDDEQGEKLTKIAEKFGEIWTYVGDDGKIYIE